MHGQNGWDTHFRMKEGNPYIQTARNELISEFYHKNLDCIFFLDDDISWHAGDALKLLEMDDEVVSGIYPCKTDSESYPVVIRTNENHYPIVRDDGCILGYCVPTGFLRITRSALEKMIIAYSDRAYKNIIDDKGTLGETTWDLFPQGIYNGRWIGEDFAFCNLWTDIGGEIWIVPDLTFTHHGKPFTSTGNYHEFLKRQPRHE